MEHCLKLLTCNRNTRYSDWIVLALFHSNLTTVNFQNFLEDLRYFHSEHQTTTAPGCRSRGSDGELNQSHRLDRIDSIEDDSGGLETQPGSFT